MSTFSHYTGKMWLAMAAFAFAFGLFIGASSLMGDPVSVGWKK